MSNDNLIWTRSQCAEAFDDMLIKIALSSFAELEGRELLKQNELLRNEPEFRLPPEHEKTIRSAMKKHERKRTLMLIQKTSAKIITRVAVVFLIMAIGFSATMTVSAELRRGIYRLLLTTTDIYTDIEAEREYSAFVDGDAYIREKYQGNLFAPTKFPAGYSLTSISDNRGGYRVLYTNENGNTINFTQMITGNGAIMSVDTENAQRVENIMVGDSEALLVYKSSEQGMMSCIVWRSGDYFFRLLSNDNNADLLADVARNIKLMR